MSANKSNIKSIGLLSGVTTINVVLSFVNSLLIAFYFGVSKELEIYFAGVTLFQLAQKLSHSGFLGEVYIPYLVKLRGSDEYNKFINSILNILIVFCVFLVGILFLFAKPLMQILIPGFTEEEIEQAIKIYKIVLPLLSITIINSFFGAILQARRRFSVFEVGSFWGQLAGLILFISLVSKLGVLALLISFAIAPIIKFVYSSIILTDIYNNYKFEILWREKIIRESILKITPFIGYTIVTQGVLFVTISIVSFLPQGSLAILKYAQLMFSKISLISTGPIVTVSFVEFSEAIKQSMKTYLTSFRKVFYLSISLSLFIAALFVISGQELIALLFAHGKFTDDDASFLYLGILVQTLSWPFMIYWVLAKKSLLVIHKTELVSVVLIVYQFVYIFFVFVLSKFWGVIGVLFATTVTSFIFVFVYYYFQKKYFNLKMKSIDLKKLMYILFILLGGVVPTVIIKQYLIKLPLLVDASIILQQIVIISISVMVYCIFLITLYKIIKIKELQYAVDKIQTLILNTIKKTV
jgi:putative peptidoglycan lipid II flippase